MQLLCLLCNLAHCFSVSAHSTPVSTLLHVLHLDFLAANANAYAPANYDKKLFLTLSNLLMKLSDYYYHKNIII